MPNWTDDDGNCHFETKQGVPCYKSELGCPIHRKRNKNMLGFKSTFTANLGTDLQVDDKFGRTRNTFRMAVKQSTKEDAEPVWLTAEIPDRLVQYASRFTKGNRVVVVGDLKVTLKEGKTYFDVYVQDMVGFGGDTPF